MSTELAANRPRRLNGRMSEAIGRTCPLCGTNRADPFLEKGVLRIVRCSCCGMLFANPVEAHFIDGQFYQRHAELFYLSADKLEGDYAPVRFARELRLFRQYCQTGA